MHTATHLTKTPIINVCRMVLDFSPYTHEPVPEKEIIDSLFATPSDRQLAEYKQKYGETIFIEDDHLWV